MTAGSGQLAENSGQRAAGSWQRYGCPRLHTGREEEAAGSGREAEDRVSRIDHRASRAAKRKPSAGCSVFETCNLQPWTVHVEPRTVNLER